MKKWARCQKSANAQTVTCQTVTTVIDGPDEPATRFFPTVS